MLLKTIKRATLTAVRGAGGFSLCLRSRWRNQRLLIVCYHGVSQDDEHEWDPELYMPVDLFTSRMEALREHRCHVLPLAEGLDRLRAGTLPERSVCLTFDDGLCDFYLRAFPVLRRYGYPATVYLTTYYVEQSFPVFPLICSYVLWKGNDPRRAARVRELHEIAVSQRLSAVERDALACQEALRVGVDYADIRRRRVLQLMNAAEVAEIARSSMKVELHTHRHRTPNEHDQFVREIRENREYIQRAAGGQASHFCYPNGDCRPEFLSWLTEMSVESATTCRPGLASRADERLLLPRLVDTCGLSALEFDSWVVGIGALIPGRPQ